MTTRDDILVAVGPDAGAQQPLRARIAAFVPITIAIVGVVAILAGGVSAPRTVTADTRGLDGIETSSVR